MPAPTHSTTMTLINTRYVLGLAGYGMATQSLKTEFTRPDGERPSLDFGYGGVELGYVARSGRLVHLTLNALVGAGGASYGEVRS
jgi:hypothetical protein